MGVVGSYDRGRERIGRKNVEEKVQGVAEGAPPFGSDLMLHDSIIFMWCDALGRLHLCKGELG